jgi:predicted alpha/beta-hydrolase family hydrolase
MVSNAMKVEAFEAMGVKGFLHPSTGGRDGLVLTHGAGGNCAAPLLIEVANAFQKAGLWVLRFDLPFRQQRKSGPPFPAQAAADRVGIKAAVNALREKSPDRIFVGGHSYGGRQASMLAAEEPNLADALLLLSYPLHPPTKPDQLRTSHFPQLQTSALFVHGSNDPFGTVAEMKSAVKLIPASTELVVIEKAGHDLKKGKFPLQNLVDQMLALRSK